MKNYKLVNLLILLALLVYSLPLFATQKIDPEAACKYLEQERFRGNLEYKQHKKSQNYSCSSLRKPINKGEPSTSDLRYSVMGTESSVSQVNLLLRMNSFKVSTPVLKEFGRVTDVIYQKAFKDNLPLEIEKSILSALRGEWSFDGYSVKLIRKHDKARVYELEFVIEFNNPI